MAIDAELINLKSAGTYRFERDKSEISNDTVTISNMRLVVGFSKIGPFNTVKTVTSTAQFIKLYGNIDRSLEKKGSFFHRSALAALSAGPILCLNLLNLDPDKDQVREKSLSMTSTGKNSSPVTLPLQSLYNTDKFWYASEESYLDTIKNWLPDNTTNDSTVAPAKNLLHFTNVGKKPVSILVKKASDYSSKNYQLTLNEWYGEDSVPEYLNGTSYVSDYLVEVYVVSGDFGPEYTCTSSAAKLDLDDDGYNSSDTTSDGSNDYYTKYTKNEVPYKRFSSDIVYQSYFDINNGFIRGTNDANLTKFLNLSSVDLKAKYVGSLIPNFVDKLGRNIWIEKLVNDDVDTVGVLCTEDVDALENVTDVEGFDFVNENIDLLGHGIYAAVKTAQEADPTKNLPDISLDFLSYSDTYKFSAQVVKCGGKIYTRSNNSNDDKDMQKEAKHPFAWVCEDEIFYADSTVLKVNDKLYASYKDDSDDDAVIVTDIETEPSNTLAIEIKVSTEDDLYVGSKKTLLDKKDNEVVLDKNANISVGDLLLSAFTGDDATDKDEDSKESKSNTANNVKYSRVTRVLEIKNVYKKEDETYTKVGILVSCSDKIYTKVGGSDNIVVKITPVDKIAQYFEWISLPGFTVRKDSMPDGTNDRQNEILDILREEPEYTSTASSLFKVLKDRDYIQWRYLVDTFGLGLEEECKNVYTKLCQARQSALALINCPSQADFKKSQDPVFTNKSGGVEAEYIANGGDQSKNPSFLFSLPSIENGASWGAYYYPYLRITDLSAAKSVPPAAYVSNLYIQKYDRGFAWSIVAGQKRGVISGNQIVGVEATLVHDNRDYLEPVGINSIIWEPGVGVEVYANKTAKQTPVSALSSAHVREAVIYIQDGVEDILRRYVFEFNTAQTRLEIKTLVDEFLNSMKSNGGLYDFKTVMDTSNNTSELIDRNMGVIDLFVEVVRGLEIISQRLTIMKTGAISSSNWD
jgi:hypothetical protein